MKKKSHFALWQRSKAWKRIFCEEGSINTQLTVQKEHSSEKVICFICKVNHFTTSYPEHPYKGKGLKGRKPKEVNEEI